MKALRPLHLLLFYISLFLCVVFSPIFFPIRCFGKEHLKGRKSFVLAVNHPQGKDGFFVIVARGFAKKMLVMGRRELFEMNAFLSGFWHMAGLFPTVKGSANKKMVEDAAEEVRKGRGLMIFPEGTDTHSTELWRLKSGAFVVAQMTGADMIPCRIGYETGGPALFRSTTVVFGPPITMAQLGLEGEYSASKLRGAKAIYREQMDALYDRYREVLAL